MYTPPGVPQGGPPKVTAPPAAPPAQDVPITAGGPPAVGTVNDIPMTPEEMQAAQHAGLAAGAPPNVRTWPEFFEDEAPIMGAMAGGLAGPVGALAGAAIGSSAGRVSRTLREGLPGPPPTVLGIPPPSDITPGQAATREAIGSVNEIASDVLTAGVLPEVGGRVVSGVLKKPGMMAPTRQIDKDVAAANREAGLRLGAQNVVPETTAGVVGETLARASEGSFVGGAIARRARQQMVGAARQAVAEGKDALTRIGQELGLAIRTGPTYDMLPHQVEASRIFAEEIAPNIIDLYGSRLSKPLVARLQAVANGGALSPALTRKLIAQVRAGLIKGSTAPVPTPLLDTLEKIVATKEGIEFGAAADLRSSLIAAGKVKDPLLPDAATRLNRKFTQELTQGMDTYQPWQELRKVYARGARGVDSKTTELGRTFTKAAPEVQAEARAAAYVPPGQEEAVIGRLSAINEAIKRAGQRPSDWARFHQIVELGTVGGMVAMGRANEAAVTVMGYEALAGLIAWAAHSPAVTKMLTEGLTSRNVQVGAATIARLVEAMNAARGDAPRRSAGAGASPNLLGVAGAAAPTRAQGAGPGAVGGGPPRIQVP